MSQKRDSLLFSGSVNFVLRRVKISFRFITPLPPSFVTPQKFYRGRKETQLFALGPFCSFMTDKRPTNPWAIL
jgi:hypothetical protein